MRLPLRVTQPLRPGFSREAKLVLGLTIAFVCLRLLLATQSSFPFHQGWNEAHYALVATGFESHPLVPRYGSHHVYNVPPLFPYMVWVSFKLFGASELAARLPTVLAAGLLLPATYALGVEIFDDRRTALVGTAVLATLPYFELYGGRAQTDIMMTALFTAALVSIVRGYDASRRRNRWLVVGGGFFAAAVAAKQPALLLAPVVLAYLVLRRRFDRDTLHRTGILVVASGIAMLPLFIWLAVNYLVAPTAFIGKWEHELFHRTPPFANLPLLVTIAGFLGFTPVVLAMAGIGGARLRRPWDLDLEDPFAHTSLLLVWIAVVGTFVAYRTPHGHQYYAVSLLPPVALLAGRGIEVVRGHVVRFDRRTARVVILSVVLLSTMVGSVVLLELSGEFSVAAGGGERISADAGQFLAASASPDSYVLVASGFRPQIQWYTRDTIGMERVTSYTVGNLSEDRLHTRTKTTNGTVYVVAPIPSWGDPPTGMLERLHVTQPYEPTLTAVLERPPINETKFGYYATSRRLAVYRVVGPGG